MAALSGMIVPCFPNLFRNCFQIFGMFHRHNPVISCVKLLHTHPPPFPTSDTGAKKFLEQSKRKNRFAIFAFWLHFYCPGGEAAEFVSRTNLHKKIAGLNPLTFITD
jgi:hypothetical protein